METRALLAARIKRDINAAWTDSSGSVVDELVADRRAEATLGDAVSAALLDSSAIGRDGHAHRVDGQAAAEHSAGGTGE